MNRPRYDRRTEALWEGIDPTTKAFWRRLKDECRWDPKAATAARRWFVSCRDAGLPTGLDADLSEPKLAKHLADQMSATGYPGLVKKGLRHFGDLRAGLAIYSRAAQPQFGLRSPARAGVDHASSNAVASQPHRSSGASLGCRSV